jgi:hypothetical protein
VSVLYVCVFVFVFVVVSLTFCGFINLEFIRDGANFEKIGLIFSSLGKF